MIDRIFRLSEVAGPQITGGFSLREKGLLVGRSGLRSLFLSLMVGCLGAGSAVAQACPVPTGNETAPVAASDITWTVVNGELRLIDVNGESGQFDTLIAPDAINFSYQNISGNNQAVIAIDGSTVTNSTQCRFRRRSFDRSPEYAHWHLCPARLQYRSDRLY